MRIERFNEGWRDIREGSLECNITFNGLSMEYIVEFYEKLSIIKKDYFPFQKAKGECYYFRAPGEKRQFRIDFSGENIKFSGFTIYKDAREDLAYFTMADFQQQFEFDVDIEEFKKNMERLKKSMQSSKETKKFDL